MVYESNVMNAAPTSTGQDVYIVEEPSDAAPDWLALGSFDLSPSAQVAATQSVELFVDRDGDVRGAQLDQLTGAVQDVSGRVDLATQTVRWTAGGRAAARFEAPLSALTNGTGAVAVKLPVGEQQWVITRRTSE